MLWYGLGHVTRHAPLELPAQMLISATLTPELIAQVYSLIWEPDTQGKKLNIYIYKSWCQIMNTNTTLQFLCTYICRSFFWEDQCSICFMFNSVSTISVSINNCVITSTNRSVQYCTPTVSLHCPQRHQRYMDKTFRDKTYWRQNISAQNVSPTKLITNLYVQGVIRIKCARRNYLNMVQVREIL